MNKCIISGKDHIGFVSVSILNARQKKAEELRRLTDQSASMSEEQLTELRADIKHFVSERKYDEDLGRAVRFTFDLEPLKTSISGFGSVYHPRTSYSNRSRCSSTSSSVAGPSLLETPPPTQTQSPPSENRPPPNKQIFQGNRRTFQGQGYYSGGQRYNGGSYNERNVGRANHRYQSDGGPSGPSQHSHSSRGPHHSSTTSNNQDRPSNNGLPQRPPRTHCP
uniref:Uncharacterized protein n=1 Tax=Cyclopterus lumpus TaxID=8103 RepID=A0A8C2ZPL8_CYCLU